MSRFLVVLPLLFCCVYSAPKLHTRIFPEQLPAQLLTLPSNATSIRLDISDSFSCDGRDYGYYADVENDCQLFHVCLPIVYNDGRKQTFRWSFICPEETVFNQEIFTCTRMDEAIECAESPKYYRLNSNFGVVEEDNTTLAASMVDDEDRPVPDVPQTIGRRSRKAKITKLNE